MLTRRWPRLAGTVRRLLPAVAPVLPHFNGYTSCSTAVHLVSLDDEESAVVPATPAARRVPNTISDILSWRRAGSVGLFTTLVDSPLQQALEQMLENRVSALLAVNEDGSVCGMVTERDFLRVLASDQAKIFDKSVRDIMTPASRLLYATPDMSVEQCSIIMNERKIRNMPVIENRSVRGMVGMRDLSWATFASVLGLKGTAIRHTIGIRGIQPQVSVPLTNVEAPARLNLVAGCAQLPHPYKDPPVSEDASFLLTLPIGDEGDTVTYAGVADGVGSWRERGVDPSAFSSSLMQYTEQAITDAFRASTAPPSPHAVLHHAWESVIADKIVGSSTACILTLDVSRSQIAAANIGDAGFIIFRDMEVSQMGSLVPRRAVSDSKLQIQYRSTQQLHGFNQPFQLGFTGDEESDARFETPVDANLMRVPVEAGDIVVLATDGLFDNVLEADIHSTVVEWYRTHPDPSADDCAGCAQALANQALELSTDRTIDSPFAVLARENDILWSGGMPDDITVVVAVVGSKGEDGLAEGVEARAPVPAAL